MSSIFEVRLQNSLTGYGKHLVSKIEEKANDDIGFLFYSLFILWPTVQKLAREEILKGFLFWPDVEYSDPGGLQEKLERLNHIMSGDWDHASRRAPYLNQCKLNQITVKGTVSRDFRLDLTPVGNLPPVSLIPVMHLDLRISLRIFEKNRNGPHGILSGAGGN
jgi:hypothetical protein